MPASGRGDSTGVLRDPVESRGELAAEAARPAGARDSGPNPRRIPGMPGGDFTRGLLHGDLTRCRRGGITLDIRLSVFVRMVSAGDLFQRRFSKAYWRPARPICFPLRAAGGAVRQVPVEQTTVGVDDNAAAAGPHVRRDAGDVRDDHHPSREHCFQRRQPEAFKSGDKAEISWRAMMAAGGVSKSASGNEDIDCDAGSLCRESAARSPQSGP